VRMCVYVYIYIYAAVSCFMLHVQRTYN